MTLVTAANDEVTGEVALPLVQLSYASWSTDLFLVANTEDVTSNGQVYTAAGFDISLPDQVDGRSGNLRWQLYDATADVLAMIRSANGYVDITVSYIFADDPDTIVAGPYTAEIRSVQGRFGVMSGVLTLYPVLDENANSRLRFNVIDFPAII